MSQPPGYPPPPGDEPSGGTGQPYPGNGQPDYGGQQYPGGGQPSYGGEPYPGGQAQRPERPGSVATAVKLMIAGGVLELVIAASGVFVVATNPEAVEAALPAGFDEAMTDAALTFGLGFVVLVGLVRAGLWFWMAWACGGGRNWARIVATIFGGIAIAGGLIFLPPAPGETTVDLVLAVLSLAISIAALVYLYRPDSNRYFAAPQHR